MNFPNLFSPFAIGSCPLKNRILMPLFPTKYPTESKVNDKMSAFYRARARGGAALIVLDCPCLDYPRVYKGPKELRFDEDEYAAGLKELVNGIHGEGAKAFMHLDYPREWVFEKPREGAKHKGDVWVLPLSRAMSLEEVGEIVEIMAAGATRAREIGYDGVEVQASYGGLIAEFLSPLLNKRADGMGGSTKNRIRFLLQVIDRVKERAGRDFPIMVKLVCDEFVPEGLGIDEAKAMAVLLEEAGADAIVANGGNKATKHRTIPTRESPPGPLVDLAARIKAAIHIPVVAIGKINNPTLAEAIISGGKADLVAMGRALIADPEFPNKAASGRTEDIRGCICCLQDCTEKGVQGIGRCCTVNPFAGHEFDWNVTPAGKKKRVLVVGGGPSGIQAAVIADQKGHDVELWERSAELGGQARWASVAPHKGEVAEALRYLVHTLEKSDVRVRLNREAGLSGVLAHKPDAVIVACGSRPGRLSIPGSGSGRVVDVRTVYREGGSHGERIVIIGGGETGCETAEWLATLGREVTIVEMLSELAPAMKKIPRDRLLSRLAEKGVHVETGAEATSIEKDSVCVTGKDGRSCMPRADRVIVAVHPVPENTLFEALQGKVKELVIVGDAALPGNIGSALRTATEAALRI
jgi:2,4-dienoyl-CoA reductase-like NADH-dependent reductase (Old Yellow Enzyme family)/thioredoxin reductase